MVGRNFRELLEAQWDAGRFLCVGLDSDFEKIPEAARTSDIEQTFVAFNRAIVDATRDLVCAYKPNSAFYEARGDEGLKALRQTIQYIHEVAPEVPVILDAKRADIGNTNIGYVESAFDHLHADSITVHPYMGAESLAPFFERKDKGIFVLCRTSNPGAGELQDLKVDGSSLGLGTNEPLYKIVAHLIAKKWNTNHNCFAFVGATYPNELGEVRSIVGDEPILTAGVGAQNGDLARCIQAGKNVRNKGIIINASRLVIFASSGKNFAEVAAAKAQQLHGEIRAALLK